MIYFLSIGSAAGGQERAIEEYAKKSPEFLNKSQIFYLKKVDGIIPQSNYIVLNYPTIALLKNLIKRKLTNNIEDDKLVLVGNRAAYMWPIFFFLAKTYLYLHTEIDIDHGFKAIFRRLILTVAIKGTEKTFSVGDSISELCLRKTTQFLPVIPDFPDVVDSITRPTQSNYRFLYCGEISEKKGCTDLINCFAKLSSEYKLTLIGRTADNFNTENLEAYENIDIIPFTKSTTVLNQVYLEADIYISLSKSESFGLSVLKALQHSIPIICTDISGHKKVLGEDYPFFISATQGSVVSHDEILYCVENIEARNFWEKINKLKFSRINYFQKKKFSTQFLNEISNRVIN